MKKMELSMNDLVMISSTLQDSTSIKGGALFRYTKEYRIEVGNRIQAYLAQTTATLQIEDNKE